MKKILILSRLLLGGLVLFELANQFNWLHFTLDFTWFGLAITSILAWLLIEITSYLVKRSTGQALPAFVWLIVTLAIYLDALGDILHFYEKFSWYDQLAHLAGGAAVAGLLFFLIWRLAESGKIKMGWLAISIFSLAITSFLGTLYEIEEYLEDLLTGSHRLGNGPDTANDLLLNILGALLIIGLIAFYKKITSLKPKSMGQ